MFSASTLQLLQRSRFTRLPYLLLALTFLASSWTVNSWAGLSARAGAAESPQRSLEVQEAQGNVVFKGSQTRRARVGDRLVTGQGLTTGKRSSAILAIDQQIGLIKVAENTDLVVRRLDMTPNGGNITLVSVNRGQVALRVRSFTNPTSRLEIRTPSGVAGVRGTEFGVGISPSGSTAVLTAEGTVAASAQGQTVLVKKGYSSIIYPGKTPTPPRPTVETTALTVKTVQRYRSGLIRFVGQVDPIDSVLFQDQPIEVDRDGTFRLEVLGSQSNYVRLRVHSPLGQEREYMIQVP